MQSLSLEEKFNQLYPGRIFLTNDSGKLMAYLQSIDFLWPDEIITSTEKPGEGNMNYVLRVITNQRSFIMKQARPWVEKYPQIEAPVQRSEAEGHYYSSIASNSFLKEHSPLLLYTDKENFILLLQDLGQGTDYSSLYKEKKKLHDDEIKTLLDYLHYLHGQPATNYPGNKAMRLLNHQHIFDLPFRHNNGIDLDAIQPGLQKISETYKNDELLKLKINTSGKIYLAEGTTLLHGDYYPGSWLHTSNGIYIIDPEFSFAGPAEFDYGIFIAHLFITGQLYKEVISQMKAVEVDEKLAATFAGVEILRRLLGVAQLPLTCSLDDKKEFMQTASNWINEESF